MHELSGLPALVWCAALGLLGAALVCIRALRPLAWLAVSVAWTVSAAHAQLDHRLPAALDGRDIALSGWIDGFPQVDGNRTIFSLHVDPRSVDLPLERLRLSWYDDAPQLRPASHLSLSVRLRHPRGLQNPGGFDYERWLFVEGFSAVGYVRRGTLDAEAVVGLRGKWLAARAELARRIDAAVDDPRAAALVAALAIGERSGFTDEQWSDFRRTGTSHLVAISGLHIGLVASFLFLITSRLARRCGPVLAGRDIELAAVAAAAGAFAYAALAGFALPTQRALLMLLFGLAVLGSRRYTNAFGGICAAVIVLLAVNPLATLTASFWMSFAAVAVLLGMAARGRVIKARLVRDRFRVVRNLLMLQCGLTVALMPLTVAFFGEVSLLAVMVNIVAIPLFSFVLVPATLLAVIAMVVTPIAGFALDFVAVIAKSTIVVLHWFAEWDYASAALYAPSRWSLLLAVCGVGFALPWHRFPGRSLAWLALGPLFIPSVQSLAPGEARLVLLDVGHGLAAVVETSHHRLLYDAGARSRSGFDTGLEVVLPALRETPRLGLDLLIVSHGDNDHMGGAAAVRKEYPETDVLLGPDIAEFEGRQCESGQRWLWDGVEFSIVHPRSGFPWRGNESSCVLRVVSQFGSILIAGDIEARAELELGTRDDLNVDVVVVPHHGSATSSSIEFVHNTRPSLALVSAGFNNRWGFPVADVSQRWLDNGAQILVTGELGAIHLGLTDKGIELFSERDRQRRYWHAQLPSIPGESTHSTL